jgi:hypothetical protein
MTRMSNQDNRAISGRIALNLRMDFGYQWTSGIDDAQVTLSCTFPFTWCDAMRANTTLSKLEFW